MFTHIPPLNIPTVKDKMTASGKRFYTTPENNRYPSITTLLGQKEKPWLDEWRTSLGAKAAAAETKRCSDRGTLVHLLAEKYLNNEPYPQFTQKYDSKIVSQFKRIRPHLNKVNNIRAQEIALYSDRLKLAGRVDCVAEYKGKLCIVDFKTSTANKTKQMIGDYFLQTTAYAIMWHEMFDEPIEDLVIMMTVENGFPAVFTDTIDKYVRELLIRIDGYYKGN